MKEAMTYNEVSGSLEDIDDLETSAAALEDLKFSLECLHQEGKYTPGVGVMAKVATETWTDTLGLDSTLPSLEAVTESEDASPTLEAIGDALKKIWEAIVRAIKTLYRKLKSFFDSSTREADKQTKATEESSGKVDEATKGLSGGDVRVFDIELSEFAARMLFYVPEGDIAKKLPERIRELRNLIELYLNVTADDIRERDNQILDLKKTVKQLRRETDQGTLVNALKRGVENAIRQTDDGLETNRTFDRMVKDNDGHFLGGLFFNAEEIEVGDGIEYTNMEFRVNDVRLGRRLVLDALELDDTTSILKDVGDGLAMVRAFNDRYLKVQQDYADKTIEVVDDLLSLIEEKNLEGAEDWVSYLRIIRNTCTSNVKSSVALANHMTHVASAINDHLIPAYTLAVLERKDNSLSTEE